MTNSSPQKQMRTGSNERFRARFVAASTAGVCFILFASIGASSALRSASAQRRDGRSSQPEFQRVALGIEHVKIVRGQKSDNEATGPWLINLLKVDLKEVRLRVAHALDEGMGLETTSSIGARYGALAAANAGFFRTTGTYRGEPSGVLVVDGKLISEPLEGRAAFGLINGATGARIIFGHLRFSGYVESLRGGRTRINGLNRPRESNELIIYTPEFHRTTLTTPDGVEAVVRRNKVVRIRAGEGSSGIPQDGLVISASGSAREWVLANLRAGSLVRVESKLTPVEGETDAWKRASFIVGGGPQLIKDGKVSITFEEEKIAAKFVSDRHPRTAIAQLKDGCAMVATVDGRQPGVSAGMSLPELADLLLEFGALEAINLDGGGSTTMVVCGKLVNRPSDPTGERPVSDALLMLPRGLQHKDRVY